MSGDQGDIIYALPYFQIIGPVRLLLFPAARTGNRMTRERFCNMERLLRVQTCLNSAVWAPRPVGVNLDTSLNYWQGLNITDTLCTWRKVPLPSRVDPWLTGIVPRRVARVVFCRSPRWNNPDFPWRTRVYPRYSREAVFVGTREEHSRFCTKVGPVPYYPTTDLLSVAEVLAGAELFVGNQSCPLALRLGLGADVGQTVVEVDRSADNCHWERPNTFYGYRSCVHLPDLDEPESEPSCADSHLLHVR